MDAKTFNLIVENRIHYCAACLGTKAKEYASDTDRLHNFKLAALMDGETPERALWGMWKKHIVSIIDLIQKLDADPEFVPTIGLTNEKLGDNINYTLLLEGLIEERRIKLMGEDND